MTILPAPAMAAVDPLINDNYGYDWTLDKKELFAGIMREH